MDANKMLGHYKTKVFSMSDSASKACDLLVKGDVATGLYLNKRKLGYHSLGLGFYIFSFV